MSEEEKSRLLRAISESESQVLVMRNTVETKTAEANHLQRQMDQRIHVPHVQHIPEHEHNGSDDYSNANVELYNGESFEANNRELDRVTATEKNVTIKQKLEVSFYLSVLLTIISFSR